MKPIKRKEQLKRLIFIQHIIIWAIICFGIGFIITKTLAREIVNRNTNNYINTTFWEQNPTTGDIFDALYSGQTIYTKNMSWYTNNCNKTTTQYMVYTGGSQVTILPDIITGNTIYVLNSWTYTTYTSQITLSGECIGLIGKGKVTFWGSINVGPAKYSIIDNISYQNNSSLTNEYTTTTGITLQIFSTTIPSINYTITGDVVWWEITWTMLNALNKTLTLSQINNQNKIHIGLYDSYNFVNHREKTIIHDNIIPTLTAVLSWTWAPISSWWIYNTGIKIDMNDINFSWVTNNSTILNGTSFIFTNQWLYNIQVVDKAGNSNSISFEIDTTPPTISNLQPSSWSTVNQALLTLSWATQENTTRIKSQKYFLYSWSTLLASGTLQAGITAQTLPNITNWHYWWEIVLEDTAGNITTGSASNITFTKIPTIFISTTASLLNNKWYTNTDPIIILSWNKNFNYTIYKSWTLYDTDSYTGTIKYETVSVWSQTGDVIVQVWYTTQDWEIGTWTFNFFIDKIIPTATLLPLWKRTNSTNSITYTRTWSKPDNMVKFYNFLMNGAIVYSWTIKSYTKTWIQVNWIYVWQVKIYDIAGNIWESIAQTTTIDQTPPTIHNVTNNTLYKDLPYPIIRDENNDPVQVTVRKNSNIILSGIQNSPYVVNLDQWEATYMISTTDIAGNSTWVTFTIDTTAPSLGLLTPSSWLIITWNNSIAFTWTGNDTNLSGFYLNIESNSYGYFSTGIYTTNRNLTINNLNNGTYYRTITATDRAGNSTISNTQYFTINVPLTGQITVWWATIIGYIQYINSSNLQLVTNINKPTTATITWDIIWEYWFQTISKTINAGSQTTIIPLTIWEGRRDIYITFQDNLDNTTLSSFQSVIVDMSQPSKPILSSINNQTYTWTATLIWQTSTDSWAGVKEYRYEIYQNNQIKKSWTTTTSSSIIQNMELGIQWPFTIRAKSIDNVWNESDRSESAIFNYTWIPDTSPDSFTFSRQTNVDREEIYRSNTITVTWLSLNTTVTASIDEGNLFVNGMDMNDRSLVKNWDVLYIELESSDEYDETTTSTLTINDKTATFKLTTEEEDDEDEDDEDNDNDYDLSDDEIDELEQTYELISILDNNLKLKFKDMLEDKIDELEDDWEDQEEIDKLRYIYDRVVEDINWTEDTIYTAPNGKTYIIIYQESVGYSSINFSTTNRNKYFSTLNEIQSFIDKNNQKTSINYTVDTSRNTSIYTAPNGKIYNIFRTTNGQYWSYNMVIPKLFSTLQDLKNHINKNNPKK